MWQIVYCCRVCCFFCPCWVWCDVVEATWIWALIVFLAIPLHLREPCLLIAARTQRYRPPLELGHFFSSAPRSLCCNVPLCLARFETSLSLEIFMFHLDWITRISSQMWMRLYSVIGMIIASLPLQRITRRPSDCILHKELYRWRRLIR